MPLPCGKQRQAGKASGRIRRHAFKQGLYMAEHSRYPTVTETTSVIRYPEQQFRLTIGVHGDRIVGSFKGFIGEEL
jgi:hypothetical protein